MAIWATSTDGGDLVLHDSGAAAWDQVRYDSHQDADYTLVYVDEGDGWVQYEAVDHNYHP